MLRLAVLALTLSSPASSSDVPAYGAKGIFPVYETAGQWAIFDKAPARSTNVLSRGDRFLVIGSAGAQLFDVVRGSSTYGAVCRNRRPAAIKAVLLRGPRRAVGSPIIGIVAPPSMTLKRSRAVYRALKNEVGDATYALLEKPIKDSAVADARGQIFPLRPDDEQGQLFLQNPDPGKAQVKIDFGAAVAIKGMARPFVFVEETQISAATRRCLRLADGDKLVGRCVPMRRDLMAETDLLQFVAYDPSGQGRPFLLAYNKSEPLWGAERWGFILRPDGPSLFLMDAMDPRCREGF